MQPFQSYFLDTLRKRYAKFSGRARRSEYWYYILFQYLIFIGISFLERITPFDTSIISIIDFILIFGLFIPGLAVAVRRLHDTGRSGMYLLLGLIPFIGFIILLVYMCENGEIGENRYGLDPKMQTENVSDHLVDSF